ncbi:type II secretion system protein GspD [Rubripirellula reticaptiva]|uniref:Type II secretion system protein D n=1 Tax=Rubripirellula reticaptiva TaxID=2528013 RepID=A0A5C6EID0_9BACT|nr:type II and III secretion system protein [Rubripirellula reticaptiva]TWU48250.1 Type II secretion system protein D precursor [Rubripirellula reticaptiva]
MPKRSTPETVAQCVIGIVVCIGIGVGCASRPLPTRPSIAELVQDSLDHSMPEFDIKSANPSDDFDASSIHHDLAPGESIIEEQIIDDRIISERVISDQVISDQASQEKTLGQSVTEHAELIDVFPRSRDDHPIERAMGYDDYFEDNGSSRRRSVRRTSKTAVQQTQGYLEAEEPLLFDEEFIETDVREVLLTLSSDAGIDLVMDENVRGVVNARVHNLPLDRAIEKVLMPLGLYYAKRGNQHFVAPPDPESPLFSYIASRSEYRPKHLETKALIDTVPKGLVPFVQEIAGSNLIVVEAPDQIAQQLMDRFAAVDQPIPQVVLEAIICVVEPDSGFQFGLDWQHAVELNGESALKLGATGLALSSTYSKAGAGAIFDDFAKTSTFIKLLNENGYLTIRASPHVMAQDNKKATIAINRETFFSVQPQSSGATDSSAFFFQQDIQTVQSGISLDITPRIRGDVVTIDIEKAEVSEDVRTANTELALNPFPIINRRSVSTTVHVKDGKTIVIGGLVQRETIDKVNRIPGLSRIPLLGYLFETTQQQTRDAEVVIFISPKIVKPVCTP